MHCKHCGGSGVCRPCQGRGWILARPDHQSRPPPDLREVEMRMNCPACAGSGSCHHCTRSSPVPFDPNKC